MSLKRHDLVHYDGRGWHVGTILRRALPGETLIEMLDLLNPDPLRAERRLVPASKLGGVL